MKTYIYSVRSILIVCLFLMLGDTLAQEVKTIKPSSILSSDGDFWLKDALKTPENQYWCAGNAHGSTHQGPLNVQGYVFQLDSNLDVLQAFELVLGGIATEGFGVQNIHLLDSNKFLISGFLENEESFFWHAFNDSGGTIWSQKVSANTGAYHLNTEIGQEGTIFSVSNKGSVYKINRNGQLQQTSKIDLLGGTVLNLDIDTGALFVSAGYQADFHGDVSALVLKLDTNFNAIWAVEVPSVKFSDHYTISGLKSMSNGDVVSSFINEDAQETVLMRVDSSGNHVWSRILEWSANTYPSILPKDIIEKSNGNVVFGIDATINVSPAPPSDGSAETYVLMETFADGTMVAQRSYRDRRLLGIYCWIEGSLSMGKLLETEPNKIGIFGSQYVSCGNTVREQSPFIVEVDANLNSCIDSAINISNYDSNLGLASVSVAINAQNDTLAQSDISLSTIGFFELDLCGPLGVSGQDKPLVETYPNPANNQLFFKGIRHVEFKLEVFNFAGQLLASKQLNRNTPMNLENLVPGTYIYKIQDGDVSRVGRFVKL